MIKNPESKLSVGEAAEACGVSPNTVRSWDRRYGFPPSERTAGGHRRYSAPAIDALASMLRQDMSISSAVEAAREMPSGQAWLSRNLETYDKTAANRTMDQMVALHSLESAVTNTLMPSVTAVGEARGVQSAAWAFSNKWAHDWIIQAGHSQPEPCRGSIVIGDANKGKLYRDTMETAALELFTKRLGFEVINFAVEKSSGISDAVNEISPDSVILAGASSSYHSVTAWSDELQANADHPVSHLFHHPLQIGEAKILPDDPYQASRTFE